MLDVPACDALPTRTPYWFEERLLVELRRCGRLGQACDFAGVSLRTVKRYRKRDGALRSEIAAAYREWIASPRRRRGRAKRGPSIRG